MQWLWLVGVCAWAQSTLLIDPRKQLRPYELERKKEGWVATGYPALGYDPLRSFGAAIAAAVAYNGKKTEESFSVQPYKQYFLLQAGVYLRRSYMLASFTMLLGLVGAPTGSWYA